MKKPYLLIPIGILIINLFAHEVDAQLTDCNVFLKGNYLEVGINWNGAYGSSVVPPSGYHPRGGDPVINSPVCGNTCDSSGGLGFVCDPDKDGWTVGSPAYYGDYFLPGTPQEGWSIMADGKQANAWNGPGCDTSGPRIMDSAMTGSNISYIDTGSKRIGIWQGMYDSILITQVTTLDTAHTYFKVKAILKNISHSTRHNVFYLRTVDPDNAEAEGGNFTTINNIVHQWPDSGRSLVSCIGVDIDDVPLPKSYMSLGSSDSNTRCFIIRLSLSPTFENLDSMYRADGGYGDSADYIYSGGDTLDVGIGLVWNLGDLPSIDTGVDSVVIEYAYIFRTVDVDSALTHTKAIVTGITNINGAEKIVAYPNPFKDQVNVSGLVASDQVIIYDMIGRKINSWVVDKDGNNSFTINGVANGGYILEVLDKNGQKKTRMLLQKL